MDSANVGPEPTSTGEASVSEAPPPSRPIPTVPSPSSDERPPAAPVERAAPASAPPLSLRDPARTSQVLNELTIARRDLAERVAEHRKMASERNALRARLGQAHAKLAELSSALHAEAKLRSDLSDAQSGTLSALRARIAELEAHGHAAPDADRRVDELRKQLEDRDAALAGRDAALADRDAALADRDAQLAQHARALADRDARLAERDQEIEQLKSAPPTATKAGGEKSGLRAIRGVGPAFERALIALGISEVSQIAEWTPEQAAEIAPKIKARIDRMLRDDWIGQARRLCGRD